MGPSRDKQSLTMRMFRYASVLSNDPQITQTVNAFKKDNPFRSSLSQSFRLYDSEVDLEAHPVNTCKKTVLDRYKIIQ